MDYRTRAKNRKFRRKIIKFLNIIKFNSLNSSSSHKVILLGALITISGLFATWLKFEEIGVERLDNGFSTLLGVSGITILLINLFIIFCILSENTKESLKRLLNISFKDYHPAILGGVVILLMIINSIVAIGSLRTFSSDIEFGKGLFIDISGTIIIIIGGVMMKKYYDHTIKGIYSDSSEQSEVSKETKNNMKLPF